MYFFFITSNKLQGKRKNGRKQRTSIFEGGGQIISSSEEVLSPGQPLYDVDNNLLYVGKDNNTFIKDLRPITVEELQSERFLITTKRNPSTGTDGSALNFYRLNSANYPTTMPYVPMLSVMHNGVEAYPELRIKDYEYPKQSKLTTNTLTLSDKRGINTHTLEILLEYNSLITSISNNGTYLQLTVNNNNAESTYRFMNEPGAGGQVMGFNTNSQNEFILGNKWTFPPAHNRLGTDRIGVIFVDITLTYGTSPYSISDQHINFSLPAYYSSTTDLANSDFKKRLQEVAKIIHNMGYRITSVDNQTIPFKYYAIPPQVIGYRTGSVGAFHNTIVGLAVDVLRNIYLVSRYTTSTNNLQTYSLVKLEPNASSGAVPTDVHIIDGNIR